MTIATTGATTGRKRRLATLDLVTVLVLALALAEVFFASGAGLAR